MSSGNLTHGPAASLALMLLLSASVALARPSPEAVDHIRDGNWREASILLEHEVAENPFDGLSLYYLGAAYQRSGRCTEAIPVLERALELGTNAGESGMRMAHFTLARCHSESGRGGKAATHALTAWRDWGLRDLSPFAEADGFQALRKNPRFRELLESASPLVDPSLATAMQADLDYFVRLVEETHPDPYHQMDPKAWRQSVQELESEISELQPWEFVSRLMRLAALVGDGHTAVFPQDSGEFAWHLLPIWPVFLEDGWYIAAASPGQEKIVGARLIGAGDVSIGQLIETSREHFAGDNEMTILWLGQVTLQFVELYKVPGATDSPDEVTLSLELSDGRTIQHRLKSEPINRDPNARFAPEDWPTMFARAQAPGWLANAGKTFWIRQFPDHNAVYASLNAVANGENESLAEAGARLAATMAAADADRLILDLRLNNGGNGNLRWEFLTPLMRYRPLLEPGALRVLIGPRSYSATMMLLADLELKFGARFYGRPTGGMPVKYSTETPFTLPNSEISGTISTRMHIDGYSADDRRPFVAPDRLIWPNSNDVVAGRDPVLDAALNEPVSTRDAQIEE